jgi:nondiscriminating aspartyl-tRNA synthetase
MADGADVADVAGPERSFVADLATRVGQEVLLRGWVRRLRETKSTTFIVLQDASGTVQVVADPALVAPLGLKSEDTVEIRGLLRSEPRAKSGFEVDFREGRLLAPASHNLPFTSGGDLAKIGQEVVLDYRPLSLRTDRGGAIFRVQAALVEGFRAGLRRRRFTEIFTSKIVSGGTEGGANLFAIKYFERTAFLAQSPQFFKEHGVAGLERVFETAHVYRAEPHATSRHLTEYYSLDFEMGFIAGPEDVIQLERELLTEVFAGIREQLGDRLNGFDVYLPSLLETPIWQFSECLDRLKHAHGRTDLEDDLDPEAERQLCAMAEKETGVSAVFVLGFPLAQRPFYTHAAADGVHSAGFDLLLRGLEVTTGGQRLHRRSDLEAALQGRGVDPASFESHLRMFELGMPPHGGLAIGSERLTAQVLGLGNVREATLYPRDRFHLEP